MSGAALYIIYWQQIVAPIVTEVGCVSTKDTASFGLRVACKSTTDLRVMDALTTVVHTSDKACNL